MKKLLLYSMMLFMALSFDSCKEDDTATVGEDTPDRLYRPMFRKEDNTGISNSTDPYVSYPSGNTWYLRWFLVNDAKAYEIKWAVQNYVANGEQAWLDAENHIDGKSLDGHVVVTDPTRYELIIEHMQYQTGFRFAIRALNSFDPTGYPLWEGDQDVRNILDSGDAAWKNDPRNSGWYGYGNGREWADYYPSGDNTICQTGERYEVPFVVQVSDIKKNSMHVTLNRSVATGYSDDQLAVFREHFHFKDEAKTVLKVDYLTFTASMSSPNARVNPEFVHYPIKETDWVNDIAEFDIDGLDENSVYQVDVWDESIPYPVDASYNPTMKRTKGDPAPPILIEHVPTQIDSMRTLGNVEVIGDISQWNSMKLDYIISNYCEDNTAENQVFYLEGGKAYHFAQNPSAYKGFTLQTNPEDVAQGKRAKLYLAGLLGTGAESTICNFMVGRQPKSGENSTITLDIDSLRFIDLDVDCPMAGNYGSAQEGRENGNAVGNYFMNMYSNGMGVNVQYLEWKNCTFQNIVRGFFRTQGSNDFYFEHIRLTDCLFYNCGYYQANGGGFNWFHCDHGDKIKSNIMKDIEISGNVFYNSPKGSLITDNNKNNMWSDEVRWNINVHNNTFVNFCTPANTAIINTRYVPGGSTLGFHDNVVILTRDAADANRNMGSAGWDVRNIQGGAGADIATFNIYNNWTTNDADLINGQPFAANAFNATSNAPGKWLGADNVSFPWGESELQVHLSTLKSTDLMESPNPENFIESGKPHYGDYRTSKGIEGLYYKQSAIGSDIHQSKAGAPILWER